jgi:mono/diheme cytochrome c family protein
MAESEKRSGRSSLAILAPPVVGLYVVVVFFFFVFRGISVRSPDEAFPRANYAAEDVVPDPAEIPPVRGKVSEPVDVRRAARATPEALADGKRLYDSYCAACHGAEGLGDGSAAAALDPKPRKLTVPDGWRNGHRVSDIFRTLTEGIEGTGMAAFDTLAPAERFALAHHVRALGPFRHAEDDAASLARLDETYGLSAGAREPNRIPLSWARERLVAEYETPAPLALPEGSGGEIRRLFERAVADPARAAVTLASTERWRDDLSAFSLLVTGGAPANGFSSAAAGLGPAEWRVLQGVLTDMVPEE